MGIQKVISLCVGFTIATGGVPALAAPATEVTQIANNLQLALSYATQYQTEIQAVQTQLNTFRQWEQGIQNLAQLSPAQWADVQATLTRLRNVTGSVQSMGYTVGNIDQRWREMYPGYRPTTDFYKDYKDLTTYSMNRVKKALGSADQSVDDFATFDNSIDKLRLASQTADGQLKAIQAGNAISLAIMDQLLRLRVLMRNQLEVQENYLRITQGTNDLRHQARENFYKYDVKRAGDDGGVRPRYSIDRLK